MHEERESDLPSIQFAIFVDYVFDESLNLDVHFVGERLVEFATIHAEQIQRNGPSQRFQFRLQSLQSINFLTTKRIV